MAILGTNLEVTAAILLIPPIITTPKSKAKIAPYTHELESRKPPCPPET